MECLASTQPQSDGSWLFDLCKLTQTVAVSTSTNQIATFDVETLAPTGTIPKAHDDVITGLVSTPNASELLSCSRDGTVKVWDARARRATKTIRATAGVLSIAHHSSLDRLAIGTELKGPDAVVSIYDSRSTKPIISYMDSHGEDVTALSWHPTNNLLLSGGQDGIINVFDTTVIEEEEAVLQVFNHGSSLHLAQFVGKNEVFAISHMETASLYKLSYAQEDTPRDEIQEFGDLRPSLAMDYCIAFDAGSQPKIFTGSSDGFISYIPLDLLRQEFDPSARVDMQTGSEVIRSVYLDEAPHSLVGPLLYAAGEDGILRVFSRNTSGSEESRIARKKERRESKSAKRKDVLRFEPY